MIVRLVIFVGVIFHSLDSFGQLTESYFHDPEGQYPSRTIALERQGDNTVQLKQVGRYAVVGLYNSSDSIIWEKSLVQDYALLGHHLVVSPDQTVTVTGYSMQAQVFYPPYYSVYGTIHTFTFDLQGTLLLKSEFMGDFPLETIKEGNSLFVLHRSNGASLTKIENGAVFGPKTLDIEFISETFRPATKVLLPVSDTEMIVAGFKFRTFRIHYPDLSGTRLVKVNKSNLEMTNMDIYPPSTLPVTKVKIHYVQKINDQTLLFGGAHINSRRDALVRYNLTTSTIEWSKEYTPLSEIYKFVFNNDKSAIYTIGTKGDDLTVRKIDTSTGNVLWTYDYNYSVNVKDIPVDIDVDLTTNKIVFVGYNEVIGSLDASDVFIHTLNTGGEFIDLIIKHGESDGQSKPNFVKLHSDDLWYIGGNLNHDGQKDGFLYSLNTSAWKVDPCVGALDGVISQVGDQLIVSDKHGKYQWVDCTSGLEIPEATSQALKAQVPGDYSVKISKDDCSIVSECYFLEEHVTPEEHVTGFSETQESAIRIFPNPATYEVSVDLGIEVNAGTISIQDSKGAVIIEQQVRNQKEVTLKTNLQRGLYFIYVKSEEATVVKKLLIE